MTLKTIAAVALLAAAVQDQTEERIPALKLKTAQGDEVSLTYEAGVAAVASKAGDLKPKAILLHFFQPDCNACHEEMIALEGLHRDFAPKGAFIAGVMHRGDDAAVRPLAERLKITYPLILGRGSEIARRLSRGDATVMADKSGVIRDRQVGFKDGDEKAFRQAAANLLEDKAVEKRSNERRRLKLGETFPDVKLPSLMTGKPIALAVKDGRLTYTDEDGKETHPKAAVGFFSRY